MLSARMIAGLLVRRETQHMVMVQLLPLNGLLLPRGGLTLQAKAAQQASLRKGLRQQRRSKRIWRRACWCWRRRLEKRTTTGG